ncbi:MAG: PEP-CTERM sorting domain-containing protein [Planctomycetota bacterium]
MTPAPEPGSIALFGLGALGIAWLRRRRRRRPS